MKKNRETGISVGRERQPGNPYLDTEPPLDKSRATGPFRLTAEAHMGDLLIFVPRNQISRTINNLTGKYGYSHLAIDCGEVDGPSGRRVMIEATVGLGVHYSFQDEYGPRPFVRLPLQKTGLDVRRFCDCVHSRVGEKFDNLEAISLGVLDNPARQICSDLVTVCLPEEMREQIAYYHHRAVIHPLSAIKDEIPGPGFRLFMSPNGFAEFLGAPRGSELEKPDQWAEPHLQSSEELPTKIWKWGDTFMTSAWRNLMHR